MKAVLSVADAAFFVGEDGGGEEDADLFPLSDVLLFLVGDEVVGGDVADLFADLVDADAVSVDVMSLAGDIDFLDDQGDSDRDGGDGDRESED